MKSGVLFSLLTHLLILMALLAGGRFFSPSPHSSTNASLSLSSHSVDLVGGKPSESRAAPSLSRGAPSSPRAGLPNAQASHSTNEGSSSAGVSSGISASELSSYLQQVQSQIREKLTYPIGIRRERIEGKLELKIQVESTGEVSRVEALTSGAHPKLQALAGEALRTSLPLPPPPHGRAIELTIPFEYRLR